MFSIKKLTALIMVTVLSMAYLPSLSVKAADYTVPEGAIEVTDHDSLVSAIGSSSPVDILIKNDFTLTGAITLSGTKILNIYAEPESTRTINSSASARHFKCTGGSNITLNFYGDIILNGNDTSGGIEHSGTLTISGGTIKNCTSSSGGAIKGGSSGTLNLKGNAKITNNKANSMGSSGGAIYGSNINLSDNVKIIGNTSYRGAIFVSGYSSVINISDNVLISGNTATSEGGGIIILVPAK